MAERINMTKKIENFEWTSLLDLTGKGLSQYNAVGQNLNCSQLMRNANLDFTVDLKPVEFTNTSGQKIVDKKLKSLVKNNEEVLVSGLTDQYHPMQNESLARLGDHFASKADLSFEHCFSYDNSKAITFLANTGGSFNIGDDKVNNYLMFNNFHTGRDKSKINTTNISIWCSNTFMQALRDKEQFMISITHRVEYNNDLEQLVKSKIDQALQSNEEYKEQAITLNGKQITESDMLKYFVLVYNPQLLNEFEKAGLTYKAFNDVNGSGMTQIKRCYGVYNDMFESNGKTYKLQNTGNHVREDTYWKAFNCVTYNEDHLRGGSDNGDSRLKNTFTMNGADNIKTRAMTTALELV
tara:strand:+ start:777 stop:1832 length:1056 start_codon:yes stop_codon:yes gene_type:complete